MTSSPIHQVGHAKIAKVVDCVIDTFEPTGLFPEWAEQRPLMETMTPDGQRIVLSTHSWVVWLGGKIVLIDTGIGNHKLRPFAPYFDQLVTPYLAQLGQLGITPDAVDHVLHTHLHVDHVGWNTHLVDGRWQPTFPNARHIFSAKEHAFFSDPANAGNRHRTSFQAQQDSVTPVIEAGLADMIPIEGQEVLPGFSFHPTPGHSMDHASIVLESAGAMAIFSGDVFHNPVQVFDTSLMSVFDPERERSLESRRWVLDFAVNNDATVFSSHFPASSAGTVSRLDGGYAWAFV